MADQKFETFSILASVKRREGQEPISEAKMLQLLRRLVKGWDYGEITISDAVGRKEEKK